jgi:hypothetical protein
VFDVLYTDCNQDSGLLISSPTSMIWITLFASLILAHLLLAMIYKLKVPVTLKVAIVQQPDVAVVLEPGAIVTLGAHAVGYLNITIPFPPLLD